MQRKATYSRMLFSDLCPLRPARLSLLLQMATRGILTVISIPNQSHDLAEPFNYECKEAHRGRREFLDEGGASIVSHERFHAKSDENSSKVCLDIYELEDIEPILNGKILLEEGGEGPVAEAQSCAYKLLRYNRHQDSLAKSEFD